MSSPADKDPPKRPDAQVAAEPEIRPERFSDFAPGIDDQGNFFSLEGAQELRALLDGSAPPTGAAPPAAPLATPARTPAGTVSNASRIEGGLLGLLVGDALGVPYEFRPANRIPDKDLINMVPPTGFSRSHPNVPPGTWSDDGAQALCLLASLLEKNGLDMDDFARKLLMWRVRGYLAVDSIVFDVGNTTNNAMNAIRNGVAPAEAGPRTEKDNGNGSLMRSLPLALLHPGSDADLVNDARLQSCVTHGHLRSQLCCALYCLWARRVLEGAPDPWPAATEALHGIFPPGTLERAEIDQQIQPTRAPGGAGSGYVVDTLHSARWAVEQGGYEQVVRAAISLGDDTDTTACVAGGIAGLRDGVDGIPQRWRDALRGEELLAPLLQALLASIR